MAKLGEMLVKEQLITEYQLEEALQEQKKKKEFLGEILMRQGIVSERQLTDVLTRQTNSPLINLTDTTIEKRLGKLMPWKVARRYTCIPVKETGNILHVALVDPSDDAALDAVAFATGKTVKTFVTSMSGLRHGWNELYGKDRDANLLAKSIDSMKKDMDEESDNRSGMAIVSKDYSGAGEEDEREEEKSSVEEIDVDKFDKIVTGVLDEVQIIKDEPEEGNKYGLSVAAEAPPIIKLVNGIIIKAMEMKACDIHIEPFENMLRIRFRIDGVLHTAMRLPANLKNSVSSRIKIMSELDIAERRLPQDGRVRLKMGKRNSIDMRISTLPSIYGEKIVIRMLGQSNLEKNVTALGFGNVALKKVQTALSNPYGMILVTGPTGSGKSTTLYTALNQLNDEVRNIVTAEDPAEYNLPGVTQVNVRPQVGYTFDMALRAFLRQDPDIIMVGEMRDYETASIAIKAALTGHLLLSTLHTNDCASTITRLINIGIDSYMVAAATKLVIAQRLVRRLCSECKQKGDIAEHEAVAMQSLGVDDNIINNLEVNQPVGCEQCNNIGYSGRLPVFEVMSIDNREIKELIIAKSAAVEIGDLAQEQGMATLSDEAIKKVESGDTSLAEALKIALVE
ncbi:GspE/PulE family protein [Planctomycetota bacterium]